MGKTTSSGNELAITVKTGTFAATGQSTAQVMGGYFNAALYGTFVGTISIERSFDGGTTWVSLSKDSTGAAASFTAPMSIVIYEPEQGVNYRFNCSAYTSGTVNYRFSV
ncbi:hypothetical protein CU669_15095 [Paramagnetospirillum kuznetsovii]|uniref:Uncharacterized protein n=1 Tax=Paramagnetospirillum kuznetsovii TaxID=2053833 RepID=A0A364NVQ9_9PROT|nr:hypothetical protein [Paramagnetospirillum kuznetsovii]RAU21080.1 hypothetical protein CU669_15095 [Paramagnetospirillum kuznetsovii]